jgi:hypothetical protein
MLPTFGLLTLCGDVVLFIKSAWSWLREWLFYILPALSNLVLVLLGIVLSFASLADKIEKTPKYRKALGVVCLAAGLIGFWSDVSQRRSSDQTSRKLLQDLNTSVTTLKDVAEKTNKSVDNTNSLVTSASLEWGQLTSLNANISGLNIKIEEARGDAKLLARLQGEVDTTKEQAAQSVKRTMATLASVITSKAANDYHFKTGQRK